MNFLEWLTTRRKTLTSMTAAELRAQEMLLETDRNRLQAKMRKLAGDKQKLVAEGAKEKAPEMRRSLAQQYDLLHTEQNMTGRQLNIRSKEMLTVSRLRMLREAAGGGILGRAGSAGLRVGDLSVIARLIENDQITSEMYSQRLDEILALGQAADEESAALSPASQELLKVWNDMDAGLIKDTTAAFDEAEKRLRERGAAEGA